MATQKKLTNKARDLQDRRLIEWMKEDLDVGFNLVVEVYRRQLNRVASGVLYGSNLLHLTEDVVQEGFIDAYRNLHVIAITDEEKFFEKLDGLWLRAWLYTIVRNKAVRCLAAGDERLEFSVGLLDEEIEEQIARVNERNRYQDPVYLSERKESIAEAHRVAHHLLNSLSSDQRKIMERRYLSRDGTELKDVSYKQIAAEMNKPEGTIKSYAKRAKKHMQKQYEKLRAEEYARVPTERK